MNKLLITILCAGLLSGCDFSLDKINAHEAEILFHKAKVWLGLESAPAPTPTPVPTPTPHPMAQANLELLAEMTRVVFDSKEEMDNAEFGQLVHSLNQGASLEGIYRGLVMGARYRGLESQSQAASPETLKQFALEMAEIRSDMRDPTEFREGEAKKPPEIVYPDGSDSDVPSPPEPKKSPGDQPKKKKDEVAVELIKTFVGSSSFTLKRVMCEEVLKRIDEFRLTSGEMNTTDLAQWYAAIAVRMAGKNIDFGVPERNKADFDFHAKWAQGSTTDRVKWEVLNRYQRYINALAKAK